MRMHTDDTDNTDTCKSGLIFEGLTYSIRGILYSVHNDLGPYEREKKYADLLEKLLLSKDIKYKREVKIGDSGNILDFIIERKVILELKAKRLITKEDYYQTQRYLQETGLKLAILVNFRDRYIKPKRIVKIENWKK